MSQLIDFYLGEGRDTSGRMIEEVWAFDNSDLEIVHDYIQWLFPTVRASDYNPESPVLSEEDIILFRLNLQLQRNLRESFEIILAFFGLRLDSDLVCEGNNFKERKHILFGSFNHNHLRVTRILDSLVTLGLRKEAKAFFAFLHDNKEYVTKSCFQHWKNMMQM
jgi:hypothetical protein